MKSDLIHLRFEKALERAIERQLTSLEVFGCDSTLAFALFLSQMTIPEFTKQAHVIVVPTIKEAEELESHLLFFDAKTCVSVLPAFDVSPYSGLYSNARTISSRVRWVHEAHKSGSSHFFIATVESITQRTLPRSVLAENTHKFRVNDEFPAKLSQMLDKLGYQSAPVVEDEGSYAIRGGIVDIFSPAHKLPVRIELFGDTLESIRFFNPETQRSEASTQQFTLLPSREILFNDEIRERTSACYRKNTTNRTIEPADREEVLQSLVQGQFFPGVDFLIGDFYEEFTLPLDHFSKPVTLWMLNPNELGREGDRLIEDFKREHTEAASHSIRPDIADLYVTFDSLPRTNVLRSITLSKVEISDHPTDEREPADLKLTIPTTEIKFQSSNASSPMDVLSEAISRVHLWRDQGFAIFIAATTQAQCQRLLAFFEKSDFSTRIVNDADLNWNQLILDQHSNKRLIHIVSRGIAESIRLNDEGLIFLRDEDFFGKKQRKREHKNSGTITERAHALSFGDLNPGDHVVHTQHGIGIYEGLKVMPIGGVDSEFIQISYKDGDKLYLPIYRVGQIQKFSGPTGERLIDKLGGIQWQKTKVKVRNHLRELASELLILYAKRSQVHRPPFPSNDDDFENFEASFPYDETDDQLKSVADIISDMTSDRPMDRLVCGDVGFGKTEVAMRAAFKAIEGQKQVAVLAPTTVLSFQHWESFVKRFKGWPVTIRALNRFVSNAEIRKTLEETKEGKVDILIGTHRLLSKDVTFKDLGLLIIDEEQRFGVTHKEKVKKIKIGVDTLTLSATPIPRTLNMSLVGMRDLSIINTPPIDRLPTRTFVTKYDEETIRKALTSEIQRGGQVFFLHNRVQSIYQVADELRAIVPEARIRVGHGQMAEDELEKTMVAFFHHQVDVLVCTTIIESGIDNPRANTMFIDNAHQFGLSQLYQLRGRVGRSKERAYCYLLIPPNKRLEVNAQERLKIIQENTALGSGIKIAHHDLELRGSGNILGEDQAGQIDAVGYEMYLELLDEAIRTIKGEVVFDQVEPEINVRIPALIPDTYISDIRIRLSYYKAMSEISAPEDMDRLEEELSDQFGKMPEQVVNLMGLMLIRHHCRELGIRDLSSGPKTVSLAFTVQTPLPPQKVVELAQKQRPKYSITPDMRLIIRLDSMSWPNIYDEIIHLKSLCGI
jgi:transcription-repair coupling factor (superfamily II helicase)